MLTSVQATMLTMSRDKLQESVDSADSFRKDCLVRHAIEMLQQLLTDDQGDALLEAEAQKYTLADFDDGGDTL